MRSTPTLLLQEDKKLKEGEGEKRALTLLDLQREISL